MGLVAESWVEVVGGVPKPLVDHSGYLAGGWRHAHPWVKEFAGYRLVVWSVYKTDGTDQPDCVGMRLYHLPPDREATIALPVGMMQFTQSEIEAAKQKSKRWNKERSCPAR